MSLSFRLLSLSTNAIDKIGGLQGLSCLTILSLARNNIKKIEGLEAVADTLEELWISYNQLEKVNGVECCKKLKVLYLANNKIKGWDGIEKLVKKFQFQLRTNTEFEKDYKVLIIYIDRQHYMICV